MSKTIRLTVGEAVVRYLDQQYIQLEGCKEVKFVENFYSIFGHGCVLGIGEALSMCEHSLKVLQGKNEQGMAHAAIAYAKMNDRMKIIPCVSSIGPGSANMVTAAATATVNNIPLLLFLGDTFASRQPDPVLQQVEQPHSLTVTTNDAFRAVSRYFDRVIRPEHIMTALHNAMRCLTEPSMTGAVAIAICQDTQGESYDYPEEFFRKRVWFVQRRQPSKYEISRAVELIKSSKKPLVIVGGGVRYSLAGKAVSEFCHEFNIPFAETQAGKSAIASSDSLNLGGIGATGNVCANSIASQADLIIALGSRLSDFTTSSKWLFAKSKVLALNASDFHVGKFDSVAVLCDIKTGITALGDALKGYSSSYQDEINEAKSAWNIEMKRLASIEYSKTLVPENKISMPDAVEGFIKATGGLVCQTAALSLIRELIPDSAVVVGASGSLPGCLQRMWTTDEIGSYNMEYGYSCMGYEIAGAFGSKLACPDKEVYALVGDGSFNMLHSELLTSLQEKGKINVLLFDNASFGCINNLQMGQGIDSLCTELRYRDGNKPIREGEFMSVDYAAVAKGYGCVSYTARSLEELRFALLDSLKQTTSTLIDIKTLPKTMTDGYGSWWNVGCVDMPRTQKEKAAYEQRQQKLKEARKY